MTSKDQAICIRTVDYSETSQILTFFTKESGKISAIAKGSKRAKNNFEGPVELFARGQIVFTDPKIEGLATLTEFQQQLPFPHLGKDLYVLHCALFAAELINMTTEELDRHPFLFDSFIQFLQNLEDIENSLVFLILFQMSLLKEIGLAPILDHCINCRKQYKGKVVNDMLYFSNGSNGIVCRDCEASFPDKIRISKTVLDCLINMKKLETTGKDTLKETEKLLIDYFTHNLGKQPKMAKYILV
jgi:DNA repair protein RecO (recombination protein O)